MAQKYNKKMEYANIRGDICQKRSKMIQKRQEKKSEARRRLG